MKRLIQVGFALLIAVSIGSAFSAQDPSVLLEKGIYTEETLGNLGDAIGIYQQVLTANNAGHATSAMALYRLGMCYQKFGRTTDAQAAFAKLVKLYPDQQNLISKIPGASAKVSTPHKVPWVDGEVLEFVDKKNNPVKTYRLESIQVNGKAAWKFQMLTHPRPQYIPFIDRNTENEHWELVNIEYKVTTVYMDASSLLPISSLSLSESSDSITRVRYTPGVVEVHGGSRLLALDREAYDSNSDQLQMILRTLPLREGWQTYIPVISMAWVLGSTENPSPIDSFRISVPVREKVTVPAGTFDCYKVIKSLNSGTASVYWISADEHAYIVKIDKGGSEGSVELGSIRRIEKNQPVALEDREFGVKISAPFQWFIGRFKNPPEIRMVDPESEAEADGTLTMFSDQTGSPEEVMNKDLEFSRTNRSRFMKYEVRAKNQTIISGLPAASSIADYTLQNTIRKPVVDYAFYFMKSNRLYKLIFHVDSKKFDSIKSGLDSIVSNLIVK